MRTISALRKRLVKAEYIRTGGNAYKALKAGGLADATARHNVSGKNTLLNAVKAETEEDIKKVITVENVLKGLLEISELAIANKDYSAATRCKELHGKWLAMFTDKQELSSTEKIDNQFSLDRLSRLQLSTPIANVVNVTPSAVDDTFDEGLLL